MVKHKHTYIKSFKIRIYGFIKPLKKLKMPELNIGIWNIELLKILEILRSKYGLD